MVAQGQLLFLSNSMSELNKICKMQFIALLTLVIIIVPVMKLKVQHQDFNKIVQFLI